MNHPASDVGLLVDLEPTARPSLLAESGQGVAIIPSALRTHHYRLRVIRVLYGGNPLREPLVIWTDNRRPLPPYALAFREMLVD